MSNPDPFRETMEPDGDQPAHLSPDELHRYVKSEMGRDERECLDVHLSCCPLCAFDVSDLSEQLVREANEARIVEPGPVPIRRRPSTWQNLAFALGGGAAVALIVLALPRSSGDPERLMAQNRELAAQLGKATDPKAKRDALLDLAEALAAGNAQAGPGQDSPTPTGDRPFLVKDRHFVLRWDNRGKSPKCVVDIRDIDKLRLPLVSRTILGSEMPYTLPPSGSQAWKIYRWHVEFAVGKSIQGYLVVMAPD